jgi:hypothetical protein
MSRLRASGTLTVFFTLCFASSTVVASSPVGTSAEPFIEQLGELQQLLRAQSPATFGGLWIDPSGFGHVAYTTGLDTIQAAASSVGLSRTLEYAKVKYSEQDLLAEMDKLDGVMLSTAGPTEISGARISVYWVDIPSNFNPHGRLRRHTTLVRSIRG